MVSGATSDLKYPGGTPEMSEQLLKDRWIDSPKPRVKLRNLVVVNFHF
jgi:hypothetical protein